MFWVLKIRLWKCLRGGRDRISCHGVLLDRTTTLWTENWCRCRPSTTCSQRTSKPFESMTKHLWLINVEDTMTWWSCSGTVNNKIINVFDWDRQNFQMNEWYRKYNSYKNQIIESVCQVWSVLTLKVAKSWQYSRYKRFKTKHLGNPIESLELSSINWEILIELVSVRHFKHRLQLCSRLIATLVQKKVSMRACQTKFSINFKILNRFQY